MDDGDSDLVRRARDGDEDAFTELFRRHSERVFRLAVSILGRGHEAEAEDLTQEVFMKIHRSLASFRGDAKVSSWIYRIAFNHALNAKARARHRKPHVDDAVLSDLAAAEPGPHAVVERTERNRALFEAIQALPEVYQSALRLYYWMDESVAEIAELLDVPENTVKSYLHRARQILDANLKEKGHDHV